jgi:fructose-1,6-bisphosphatase/inositol monophosphatase family enzyme
VVQDSSSDAAALLAHIEAAAIAAAAFIRARALDRANIEWRSKSATDFVSDIDTGAERIIRSALQAAYPDALILGEELSPDSPTSADVAFIVDPLDGTTNFLHGYPEFAVSIAAAVRGELVAAVIIDVPAGDRFTATLGGARSRERCVRALRRLLGAVARALGFRRGRTPRARSRRRGDDGERRRGAVDAQLSSRGQSGHAPVARTHPGRRHSGGRHTLTLVP